MDKSIKKIITVITTIALLTSTMSLHVWAAQSNLSTNFSGSLVYEKTAEDEMPTLKSNRRRSGISNLQTIQTSERKAWVEQTKEILENTYHEKVAEISENEDYITFHYNNNNIKDEDLKYDHIEKTEYLKPESTLAAAATIQTKINYVWAWSDGYYKIDSKSGKWGVVKDFLLAILGTSSKTVLSVFSSVLGIATSSFATNSPIKVDSMAKYYYYNKVGYVKAGGYWLPYAYVGSRRGFKCITGVKKDSSGQPTIQRTKETKGTPSNNPTNYDDIKKKANFDNNTWIRNKAISQYKNDAGVYTNVYGTGTHLG